MSSKWLEFADRAAQEDNSRDPQSISSKYPADCRSSHLWRWGRSNLKALSQSICASQSCRVGNSTCFYSFTRWSHGAKPARGNGYRKCQHFKPLFASCLLTSDWPEKTSKSVQGWYGSLPESMGMKKRCTWLFGNAYLKGGGVPFSLAASWWTEIGLRVWADLYALT